VRFFYAHSNFIAQSASARNFRRFFRGKIHQNKIFFNFLNAKAKKTELQTVARQKTIQKRNFISLCGGKRQKFKILGIFPREKMRQHSILCRCAEATAFPSKFHAIFQ